MINKNYDLLGEQLAESGLEMTWVGAAIGAVTAIAGGIMGSNDANNQNKQSEKNYKKQKKAAQAAADATNEYNKIAFEIEKQNYQANKTWQIETANKKWKYDNELKDYAYKQATQQYAKSVSNTQDKLTYNSLAAIEAKSSEQQALNDLYTETAFNKQGSMVEQLQSMGKASLGQAGNSRNKAMQSTLAALGRNNAIIDASLSSSVEQSQRNLQQIKLQKFATDKSAMASMMIKPEELPAIPKPTFAPDPIFLAPMKALPQAIQAPTKVSTSAPLVAGFGGAASQIAKIDFGGGYESPWGQGGGSNMFNGSTPFAGTSNIASNAGFGSSYFGL